MKAIKASDLLDERYGKSGTEQREQFRAEAFSYYFAEIIKNRRKQLHLSQEDLARKMGKQRPYISRMENGEDIRLSNLVAVAEALELTIEITPKQSQPQTSKLK